MSMSGDVMFNSCFVSNIYDQILVEETVSGPADICFKPIFLSNVKIHNTSFVFNFPFFVLTCISELII